MLRAVLKRLNKKWFGSRASDKSAQRRTVRLGLETLESRVVPTVTYHGGAVLQNVEVQGVYYGSDWSGNAAYSTQRGQLDGFLQFIVKSGYTSQMLNNAYGTGAGSFSSGYTNPATLDKTQYLTDSAIRNFLRAGIGNGWLQQPDANRLYVVFVEDNVAVQDDSFWDSARGRYDNSVQDFLGYHGAFAGSNGQDIHYAVIAYPGGSIHLSSGTVANAGLSWLSSFNDMTEVASHELAEAITDPNVNYKTLGWYDDQLNGEVGDLCNAQMVYAAGYAVQRIVDRNDQPMTPWSAGTDRPVNFVLMNNHQLLEFSSSGTSVVASNVASVSDQGIDNYGRAMVDFITTSGSAYEFHDRSGPVFLWNNAVQARAGQGVSYVLFSNGYLDEYHDATATWTYVYNGGIQSIDAGTDKYLVNSVDMVLSGGNAWMYSDTDGWHFLMGNVWQVSAGQEGLSALLDTYGNAYVYNEWTGSPTWLTSGARQVTTGYDTSGDWTVGVVLTNGAASLYHENGTWSYLASGVAQMSKENLGVIDVLFSSGSASDFDTSGQHSLVSSGAVAVA
jgi:hypothetical protein